MENLHTSVEQSKKLLSLNINPNTASLNQNNTPLWTTDDLISIIPDKFKLNIKENKVEVYNSNTKRKKFEIEKKNTQIIDLLFETVIYLSAI